MLFGNFVAKYFCEMMTVEAEVVYREVSVFRAPFSETSLKQEFKRSFETGFSEV